MSLIKSRKHPALALIAASLSAPLWAQTTSSAQPANDGSVLPTVKVSAERDAPYRAESANGKYTAPLLDTPQSIQIIPEQVLREQNATTLTEALRNSAGVSTFYLGENGSTSTGDAVYMRGYDASSSIFVDGVRDTSTVSRDVFNIAQVEVVKGAAGSDVGRSSPSGYVNLITKKPTLENALIGTLGWGSAASKRATIDWNRSLDRQTGTALRLNALVQDAGVPGRDVVRNKRWAVAPSLALGLGSDTRIFVDAVHVKQDNIPDGGVPTIGLPGYTTPDATRSFLSKAPKVDSSNFYGTSSDFDKSQSDMLTLRVEHELKSGMRLTSTTRYGRTAQNYMLTSWTATAANLKTPSATDLSTWTLERSNPNNKDQVNTVEAEQLALSGEFRTAKLKHSLSSGLELSREEQHSWGYYGALATVYPLSSGLNTGIWTPAALYHPEPDASGYVRLRNGATAQGTTTTFGLYLFDTVEFDRQWLLSAGVRLDRYKTSYFGTSLVSSGPTAGSLAPTTLSLSDTLFTGKIGLTYKPVDNASVYADYASGAQPPGGSNFALATGGTGNSANRVDFAPQKTHTYEIGTKWDLLANKLGLTGAVYRTEVLNQVVQDASSLLYDQTGQQRVQGVELGIVGQLTDRWGVSAGYTSMDTKIISGPAVTKDGSMVLAYTPRNSLTLWTSYDAGHGLSLGLGAVHNAALHRGTDGALGTPTLVQGYTVVNALLSYQIDRNLTVQLNLNNLFDKAYVAAINKSGYRYTPGAERSGQLTATFAY